MTIRILQLTDFHVFATPDEELKGICTRECLQNVVAHVIANEAPFDHVIVTGDHTHDERPESYQAVREILSHWGDRLWQVPGNHDDRELLAAALGPQMTNASSELIQFNFETGDWLCVGLDTHLPGEVAGQLSKAQMKWLAECIASHPNRHVALFMHHPPVDMNSAWMDRIGLNGREHLEALIDQHTSIHAVFCGHVHHESEHVLGTARVYTTPATGIQFDPSGTEPNFSDSPPGYRVIELDGSKLSTHVGRLPA